MRSASSLTRSGARPTKGNQDRTVIRNATAGGTAGGESGVILPPPIKDGQYRTVMLFRTHPGPASNFNGEYNSYARDTDFQMALELAIPSAIGYGPSPTWNDSDYFAFGGSFSDERGNPVTSATPNAREMELEVVDKRSGKTVTRPVWFLNITRSDRRCWGWDCPATAIVTGNATSSVGHGGASGDRLTKRVIRSGPEGLETVESPHLTVPGPGSAEEDSAAAQIPSMEGFEQAMAIAGQTMTPEQVAAMQQAIEGAMASPTAGLTMNSGWVDRERVEFIPLCFNEPVVCSTSLDKTYPSFMSQGQDQVTGTSDVRTTFTSAEHGFTFVTEQELRANAVGRMEGSGPEVLSRSKATASASAVVHGIMEFEYTQPTILSLKLLLSQEARFSSQDPPMVRPPLKPGNDPYWEATATVTDSDGQMVDRLWFPKLICPGNDSVTNFEVAHLPPPPEGQVYTVMLLCSQQGGNYTVVGPGMVPGSWAEVSVTIRGQVWAHVTGGRDVTGTLESLELLKRVGQL